MTKAVHRRVSASWLTPATAMVVALAAIPVVTSAILIANALLATWPTQ